jgi:Pyridine nucleotide-disulphide oxidoreductase
VRIVGERWSPSSHRLRDALTRNTVPIGFYDVESDEGRRLVDQYDLDLKRLPVVILHNGSVLYSPTLVEVAEAIGVHNTPSKDLYDVAIVGAGPAGLAAGVYGASEGLRTIVIESESIGGQAGSSSLIRNYLGFPRGVSGDELAFRAWEQMLLFGAQFAFTEPATGLSTRGEERVILLANADELRARAVVIAAGVSYRRLGIPSLDRLIGAGVFYGTAGSEAREYTVRAARAFDRACQLTGLSAAKLCRELTKRMDKETSLSRQTLAAWRHGVQGVPLAAFMATAELAGLRPPVILALAAEEFDQSLIPTEFSDSAPTKDPKPSGLAFNPPGNTTL